MGVEETEKCDREGNVRVLLPVGPCVRVNVVFDNSYFGNSQKVGEAAVAAAKAFWRNSLNAPRGFRANTIPAWQWDLGMTCAQKTTEARRRRRDIRRGICQIYFAD